MIDYIRTYKQFVSSHHFYEGLRMTIGVMTPIILLSYYGNLSWGITVALGAVCVSITDNPGPVHHRRNGMLFTVTLLFATIFITGISVPFPWMVVLLLATLPFAFSMLNVFGARAGGVGLACMLVMTLNIDKTLTIKQVLINASLTTAGGIWYFLLSMVLHQVRPYKLVQQVLGDCIRETAAYVRIKARFYDPGADINKVYEEVTQSQIQVHFKQETVRELLFKTRSIVKESTHTGRVLVMAFLESVDLFERVMTTQQEYSLMHKHFDDTPILAAIQSCILQLADDLEAVGIAFQQGTRMDVSEKASKQLLALDELFSNEKAGHLTEENAFAFMGLGLVLNNIKDVKSRIDTLYKYSSYDLNLSFPERSERDSKRFVTRSQFGTGLIWDNLNKHSNIFRHAIRVSLALITGYILSMWLPLGHDYWILLTIIVILKPAYALTRQRNIHRLAGTVGGAVVGALALYFIKDTPVLIGIILICMIAAYSMLRTNYFGSVFFMTIFILMGFHFLKVGNAEDLLKDRIVDTAIGSGISFLFIFLLPPKWEHENIRTLCIDAIEANKRYFAYIARAFTGEEIITQQYKLRRKETFVALANLSDAFQRMLNEPKSKQQQGDYFHQLVVSNHVLASQAATLSAYRLEYADLYRLHAYNGMIVNIEKQLECAEKLLRAQMNREEPPAAEANIGSGDFLQLADAEGKIIASRDNLQVNVFSTLNLLFGNIYRVATDIKSVCKKLE